MKKCEPMSKYCLECNKEYFRRKWGKHIEKKERWEKRQFCSHECSNKSPIRIKKCIRYGFIPRTAFKSEEMLGEKHPQWKGGKPRCLDCNASLSAYHAKYCKKHFGLHQRGPDHPTWIEDRTHEIEMKLLRSSDMCKEWKHTCLKRDKYKCRIQNQDCSGKLEIHHILPWRNHPKLRFDVNNGITLCHAHHPRAVAEEKRLESYFMELVSVSSE